MVILNPDTAQLPVIEVNRPRKNKLKDLRDSHEELGHSSHCNAEITVNEYLLVCLLNAPRTHIMDCQVCLLQICGGVCAHYGLPHPREKQVVEKHSREGFRLWSTIM